MILFPETQAHVPPCPTPKTTEVKSQYWQIFMNTYYGPATSLQ